MKVYKVYMGSLREAQYATITQGNTHFDRRVYENECGELFVKINGELFSIKWLEDNGRKVNLWF